jgi:hypothetical protein
MPNRTAGAARLRPSDAEAAFAIRPTEQLLKNTLKTQTKVDLKVRKYCKATCTHKYIANVDEQVPPMSSGFFCHGRGFHHQSQFIQLLL